MRNRSDPEGRGGGEEPGRVEKRENVRSLYDIKNIFSLKEKINQWKKIEIRQFQRIPLMLDS